MTGTEELLFEKGSVFIHTTVASADEDALVEGKVVINRKPGREGGVFVEWKYVPPNTASSNGKESDWTVVDSVGYKNNAEQPHESVSMRRREPSRQDMSCHRYIINFNIKDLKSFKRSKPNLGWSYLILILKDGTTYPPLHFHRGGTKSFIEELRRYLVIKKSHNDSCLYLVREQNPHALTTSFDELKLFDKDQAQDVVSKFFKDPYTSTWSGFSKVTSMLKHVLMEPEEEGGAQGGGATGTARGSELSQYLSADDFSGLGFNLDNEQTDDTGFEIVERREKLPPRPQVKRDGPVSPQRWSYHMDEEGRVTERDKLMQAIFRGGIDPSLRIEVWKFMLGYYKWDSTYKDRTEERKKKVDSYFAMKLQWKSISAEQEKRFSTLKERKNLIDKDVSRTDRTHDFFKGENNPNLVVLYDILMTYCMYNFDLGYVQGMSDLLAPVLVVMENEVDAFWCFAGFMERLADNFSLDQAGMKQQLADLYLLLKFVDPELSNHLESHESSNMFFCFRWLLIMFKREFIFSDIMRLWEVLWTDLPCTGFHLLLSIAILDTSKTTLIDNNFGFTEILKHVNDLSFGINLEDTLKKAEAIYLQLTAMKQLPESIQQILGMALPAGSKDNVNVLTEASSTVSTPSQGGTPRNMSTPSTPEKLSPRREALTPLKSASADRLSANSDDTSIVVLPEPSDLQS